MLSIRAGKLLLLALFVVALAGCVMDPSGGRRGGREANDTPPTVKDCPTSSPSQAVEALLTRSCKGCHSTQQPVLATSVQIKAAVHKIVDAVNADRMPPGKPLSAEEKKILADWRATETASKIQLMLAQPTYWNDIKPIIDTKCTWCHSAAAKPEDKRAPFLTTYAGLIAQADDVQDEVADDKMPPRDRTPRLSNEESKLLDQWFATGMPEGLPPAPIDPTKPIFYKDTIQSLLTRSCIGCHGSGGKTPLLEGYPAARLASTSALAAVKAGRMPPSGVLSEDALVAFEAWVTAGTPYDSAGTTPPVEEPKNPPRGPAPADCLE